MRATLASFTLMCSLGQRHLFAVTSLNLSLFVQQSSSGGMPPATSTCKRSGPRRWTPRRRSAPLGLSAGTSAALARRAAPKAVRLPTPAAFTPPAIFAGEHKPPKSSPSFATDRTLAGIEDIPAAKSRSAAVGRGRPRDAATARNLHFSFHLTAALISTAVAVVSCNA